jgi:hypothetical protein
MTPRPGRQRRRGEPFSQQIPIQIDLELPGESRVGTIHFQLFRG